MIDGSFHEVDSNEMAFKLAGAMAFREGVEKGATVLLEPIMKVDITVPDDYFGDVLGQISSRRGEIQGTEMRTGNAQAVRAVVPLAEMFGYATELRSITQGRGVFTMEFEHYAPVSDCCCKKDFELIGIVKIKPTIFQEILLWQSRNLNETSRI